MSEHVQSTHNQKTNTVFFDAEKEKFYPGYLKYLLEYLKIPANAKLVFKGSKKAYILNKGATDYDTK